MDKWGRPDINTGLGLMRGMMDLKTFQNRQQDRALEQQDREDYKGVLGTSKAAHEGYLAKSVLAAEKTDKDVYEVANLLTDREEGTPLIPQGGYSDEAWVKGHQRYQQGKQDKLQTELTQVRLTREGQAEQVSRIGTRIVVTQDSIKNLLASKQGGASKIEQGIQMVKTLSLLPNGYTGEVIQSPEGSLQFKWSNSAGEEGVIDVNDSNIDGFLNEGWGMVKAYMKKDPAQSDEDYLQKRFELGAKDDLWRQSTNADVTSKAISNPDAVYRGKDGKIFYLVRGLIEPTTGTQYPPSFVTGVNSKVVIPVGSDEARELGLRPWKETTAELSRLDKESSIAQRGKVTPRDEMALNKDRWQYKKEVRKQYEEFNPRPEKGVKQWELGRTVAVNNALNEYDTELLGEEKARAKVAKRVTQLKENPNNPGEIVHLNAFGEVIKREGKRKDGEEAPKDEPAKKTKLRPEPLTPGEMSRSVKDLPAKVKQFFQNYSTERHGWAQQHR